MTYSVRTACCGEGYASFGLLLVLALAFLPYVLSVTASQKPHVLMVVADDLGRNDLGYFNGGKSETPAMDALLSDGIFLAHYYSFKVCAPTRTSIMTGRYAWRTGFYEMVDDGGHCVNQNYTMLPALLRANGYATHAIGKWNVGGIVNACTPTYAGGFDSFLGYYAACQDDYFTHNGSCTSSSGGIDMSYSVGHDGEISGARGYSGVYSTHIFRDRAVDVVMQHAAAATSDTIQPLFMYLAFQNVHLACGGAKKKKGGEGGIQGAS